MVSRGIFLGQGGVPLCLVASFAKAQPTVIVRAALVNVYLWIYLFTLVYFLGTRVLCFDAGIVAWRGSFLLS